MPLKVVLKRGLVVKYVVEGGGFVKVGYRSVHFKQIYLAMNR